MHLNNIVHRDLKIENILIDTQNNNNSIKIIDFGFASYCQKDQKIQFECGTPQYMCPDLTKRAKYYGQAADIWALGVILFILITGNFPFYAEFEEDLNRKIQKA